MPIYLLKYCTGQQVLHPNSQRHGQAEQLLDALVKHRPAQSALGSVYNTGIATVVLSDAFP
jgi:hypothetical protein